jgi:hypothetical protein
MSTHELIGSDELSAALQPALLSAIGHLAPVGSNRSVPINVFCDCLTDLMAGLLIASPEPPETLAEIERLSWLFSDKLTAAVGLQQQPVGHA